MPSQSFRATAETAASVDHAWSRLQLPEVWEGIAGVDEVAEASHVDGRLTGFAFSATVAGRRYPGTSTVTASTPPDRMRLQLDTTELLAGIDLSLHPAGSATEIHVSLTLESKSFLAGMFFPSIADGIDRGLPTAVAGLARRLSQPL